MLDHWNGSWKSEKKQHKNKVIASCYATRIFYMHHINYLKMFKSIHVSDFLEKCRIRISVSARYRYAYLYPCNLASIPLS
uniref:Uncharacterized protein n=1 Tax=Arundo donax TaxID=35708 RepID=A0A0A9EQ72_ARUDO